MTEEGHLPPRDIGRAKTSAPMEHGASTEILPIEIMWRTTTLPNSPDYLILLQLLVLLRQFCYNILYTFLSPRGQVHSYKRMFFFVFKRWIFRHNYVLLPKFLQVHKSGQITQRCWKFLSTKWTNHPKRVKILSSPQEWTVTQRVEVLKIHKVDGTPKGWKFFQAHNNGRITQRVEVLKIDKVDRPSRGWKFFQIHRVDGSPKEGENSYKSTKWMDHLKRVKILIHKVDRSPK